MPDPEQIAELERLVEDNRKAFERAKRLLESMRALTFLEREREADPPIEEPGSEKSP
jgi:hypothetical protein